MTISVFRPGGVGDFEFPATDGTAGQVLVTNGAGVLSFSSSLPDGVIIGGVMHFNRPTKPTERSPGVPLVVHDRWYNTSDGTEWGFNGTYWLSSHSFRLTGGVLMSNTTVFLGVVPRDNIFLEKIQWRGACRPLPTNNNYYYVQLQAVGLGGVDIQALPITLDFRNHDKVVAETFYFKDQESLINTPYSHPNLPLTGFSMRPFVVGSMMDVSFWAALYCRDIAL